MLLVFEKVSPHVKLKKYCYFSLIISVPFADTFHRSDNYYERKLVFLYKSITLYLKFVTIHHGIFMDTTCISLKIFVLLLYLGVSFNTIHVVFAFLWNYSWIQWIKQLFIDIFVRLMGCTQNQYLCWRLQINFPHSLPRYFFSFSLLHTEHRENSSGKQSWFERGGWMQSSMRRSTD